jgi:phenylacetate-CoA ligase
MTTHCKYYDAREIADPEARERSLFERLPSQIEHAKRHAPAYSAILADVSPGDICSRNALANVPITRKSALAERQQESPPFGGFAAKPAGQFRRIYASPGPIYEPESDTVDYWRLARALYASGIRAGDVIHNAYSYHLTPAGFMLESGAFALGCTVVPGGIGQTELQVKTINTIRPSAYVGTPSFLKIILDKADELALDVSCITNAAVSGEALPETLRKGFMDRGLNVLQSYATADVGLIGYESEAKDGLILAEDIIVEIVRPGSGEPVSQGEVGEVVVTVLNPDYPLIRFATGDLSAKMSTPSSCGRTNDRIKGWMGRADQTTKVKGMFVRPEQVNAVAARHVEIEGFRMTVSNPRAVDELQLACESASTDENLALKISETIRDLCKLRAKVVLVAIGSLPNDGKVIADERNYD